MNLNKACTNEPSGMASRAMGADKRGPKVGDAASLWNFTPSPGWSKDEAAILKAALCVYGIGKWVQIVEAKVLPGKVIQQLNGQTQRLLGQQSIAGPPRLRRSRPHLGERTGGERASRDTPCRQNTPAAFNGLQVDIDRVRADNNAKVDVERKSGLVINSGRALEPPAPKNITTSIPHTIPLQTLR